MAKTRAKVVAEMSTIDFERCLLHWLYTSTRIYCIISVYLYIALETNTLSHKSNLIQLIKDNNGIISSSQVTENNIPRFYLGILIDEGFIERVNRGVYLSKDAFDDEFYRLQNRYKRGVFSHATALYFHDLTDRTPSNYSMTFPNQYHAKSLKESNVTPFYTSKEKFGIGLIKKETQFGRMINTYNEERTIIDIFRNRNQLNSDMIKTALLEYLDRKGRNIPLLLSYARMFRVERVIGEKLEFLL